MSENKILSPKVDVVFQSLFGEPGSERITKRFLENILGENRKLILTDKLEIIILELKKIKGKERVEGELLDWLFFIDNPNSERVKEKMKENKELKEANEKLQTMSEEEYMERMAWFREKAILDYNSGMSSAIRRGKIEGEKKAKLETAKKLLKQGVDINIIIEATGLSKEEIMKFIA